MIINYYKPLGKTSFSVIKEFKEKYPGEKVGYVGTLDPMAEGAMVILTGSDTKRCEELVKLPKEYEFDVVFGVSTDSGDVLGLVDDKFRIKSLEPACAGRLRSKLRVKNFREILKTFLGEYQQTVPAFSSVKVKGRKLHEVSRKKHILKNDLPKRPVNIHEIALLKFYTLPYSDFEKEIFGRLGQLGVFGKYFRIDEVVKRWKEYFAVQKAAGMPDAPFADFRLLSGRDRKSGAGVPRRSIAKCQIATIRADVSKGTYIRSLAEDIGEKLGVSAMCLSIRRTKVGLC